MRNITEVGLYTTAGASANIMLHGAHVTSWQPIPGKEVLFLSKKARFANNSSIRGGVPIIFPQFSDTGELPKHGFARRIDWSLEKLNRTSAVFSLQENEHTLEVWPCKFRATYNVLLEKNALSLNLEIANMDKKPIAFTSALHSYFGVSNIHDARISGLEEIHYTDENNKIDRINTQIGPVKVKGEIDRIYLNAPGEIILNSKDISLVVQSIGFKDLVVWNPGPDKVKTISDLDAKEYKKFICIESATVIDPVHLAPRERWMGIQKIIMVNK